MLSVVLPVYNEAESIVECIVRLHRVLNVMEHELLICYDFEEDSTLPIIDQIKSDYPTIRLVKNNYGRGAANAIKAGIDAACGDIIITTMADLSDPPDIIPSMVKKIENGADVVCASRYMRGGSLNNSPLIKGMLSRLAGLSLRFLSGINTYDSTNNFRAYRKEIFDNISIESKFGFEIGLEIAVKAHLNHKIIDEIPSSWEGRELGESKFKLIKWLPEYLRWYWLGVRKRILILAFVFMVVLVLVNYFSA